MPNEPQLIYWDSCVVIAYLNNEPGRIPTLEAILDEVGKSDGKRKIVTSQVSKVEVAFIAAESQKKRLSDEVEKAIDEFWADDSVLELIEFHDGIAELARKIIRDGLPKGWKLKPLDAIHLATAKLIKATEFQTYDLSDCKRYESDLGIKICEPYVVQPKLI